jgi:hypothetical protein
VGETLNISSTGVLICCNEPLKINEVFELVIEIRFTGSFLNATAQVVWLGIRDVDNEFAPHHIMGMRFSQISDEHRHLIFTLLSDHF